MDQAVLVVAIVAVTCVTIVALIVGRNVYYRKGETEIAFDNPGSRAERTKRPNVNPE